MTRTTIVAAAIAGVVALAAPAAFAQPWPGTGSALQRFEPDIPAGALPPGPAVAEMTIGVNHYRVRFDMPATGPARLAMWNELRSGAPGAPYEVVVKSDRGGMFRTTAEPKTDGERGPPLFLGSADEIAAFSRRIAASSKAVEMMQGIVLAPPSQRTATPDCRRLANARIAVVVLRDDDTGRGLLGCAARGAGLLIIGRPGGSPDDEMRAFARLDARHPAVPWGLGAVAWLSHLETDVAAAVLQIDTLARKSGFDSILSSVYGVLVRGLDPKPKGVPGSGLVLLLLALYVAVIGPVGYFVGVRPRRAWLAWSWFPLVALAATVALAAGSTLWRGKTPELGVHRVSLVSPTGVGLETSSIFLQGSSSARFSVSAPWREGDLRNIERGYRLGTPFSSPAGSLTFTDDRVAGRLAVDGLTVGRFGDAGVAWVASVAHRAPEVVWRGQTPMLVNRTAQPILRATIRTADSCGTVTALPVGGERPVASQDCAKPAWPQDDGERDWAAFVLNRLQNEAPAPGTYLLAVERDEPQAVEVSPAVALRAKDVLVVRGPVAGGEQAP